MLPGAIFGVFSAGSKTTLSCAYLWTELLQTRFPRLLQAIPPESSFGNGKTPLLAVWHGFGVFLAGSKTTLFCAYLWTELHQIRFRGLLQAIPPESSVENGKIPVLAAITPILLPGATFGVFSAGSKTTLSCTYLWTELHQTRFPRLLQAIPPESNVGNRKTPLLADWHGFGGFLAVFRLAPRRRCPALTLGPNCTQLGFLGLCRPLHRNQALKTGKYQY